MSPFCLSMAWMWQELFQSFSTEASLPHTYWRETLQVSIMFVLLSLPWRPQEALAVEAPGRSKQLMSIFRSLSCSCVDLGHQSYLVVFHFSPLFPFKSLILDMLLSSQWFMEQHEWAAVPKLSCCNSVIRFYFVPFIWTGISRMAWIMFLTLLTPRRFNYEWCQNGACPAIWRSMSAKLGMLTNHKVNSFEAAPIVQICNKSVAKLDFPLSPFNSINSQLIIILAIQNKRNDVANQ